MPSPIAKVARALLLASLGALGALGACGEDTQPRLIYNGSWIRGWPQLGHDGKPYEDDKFIVFSDKASLQARQYAASIALESLDAVKTLLEVSEDDFAFLGTNSAKKIHVFVDYGQWPQARFGLAYRDGIIVRSSDSPLYRSGGYTPAQYRRVIQHEITHVIEFLLIGDATYQQANDVWLREGFASYSATIFTPVNTVADLDAWREKMKSVPGGGNPIGIHLWRDFPQEVVDSQTTGDYYPLFELATRYLLDANGNGTGITDLKGLYEDLGEGMALATAFSNRFGVSLATYEAQFFDLMRTYLAGN